MLKCKLRPVYRQDQDLQCQEQEEAAAVLGRPCPRCIGCAVGGGLAHCA